MDIVSKFSCNGALVGIIHCDVRQGTAAGIVHTRMVDMGSHGLQDDRNHPGRSNGDFVGSLY